MWRLGFALITLVGLLSFAATNSWGVRPFGSLTQLPGREGCVGLVEEGCSPGTVQGDSMAFARGDRYVFTGDSFSGIGAYRRTFAGALGPVSGKSGCLVVPVDYQGRLPRGSPCGRLDLLENVSTWPSRLTDVICTWRSLQAFVSFQASAVS